MQKLSIQDQAGTIYIQEVIDEDANFSSLTDSKAKKLVLNLKGITRINSSGVREWIKAVQKFPDKTEYHECSEPIVEQINMISNFIPKGRVVSFYAPYVCDKCNKDELVLLSPDNDFQKKSSSGEPILPIIKCKGCGTPMVLDEDEEEYFLFLWK